MLGVVFFTRRRLACRCGCGFDTVDSDLTYVLEDLREMFGVCYVTSGCRCPIHNLNEGGSEYSQHLKGKAADIKVVDLNGAYEYLCKKYPNKFGFGLHKTFLHIDVRSKKWRKIYK
jgi:uncharacterized protein YcbK (DUF882 family)